MNLRDELNRTLATANEIAKRLSAETGTTITIHLREDGSIAFESDGFSAPNEHGLVQCAALNAYKATLPAAYAAQIPTWLACQAGRAKLQAIFGQWSDEAYIIGEEIKAAGMSNWAPSQDTLLVNQWEAIEAPEGAPAYQRLRPIRGQFIPDARAIPGIFVSSADVVGYFETEAKRKMEMDADGIRQGQAGPHWHRP